MEETQVEYAYPPTPSVAEMVGLGCAFTTVLTVCFILVMWIHSALKE